MKPQEYIKQLQIETGKTLAQISEESGIPYASLLNFSTGKVSSFSSKIINKLAAFEGINPEHVIYKLLLDKDNRGYCTEEALLFLAHMKYNDRYSVNVSDSKETQTGTISFDGSYYLTRNGGDYTLVDSWDNLKKQYWNEFFSESDNSYNEKSLKEKFNSYESYLRAIFMYGIYKVFSIKNEKKKIAAYHIAFNSKDDNEKMYLFNNVYLATVFEIRLWSTPVLPWMKYKNLFSLEKEVQEFNDLYWYCIERTAKQDFDFGEIQLNDLKIEQYKASKMMIDYLSGNDQKTHLALLSFKGAYPIKYKVNTDDINELRNALKKHIEKTIEALNSGISDNMPLDINLAAIKYNFGQYIDLFSVEFIETMKSNMPLLRKVYNENTANQ